jgi:PAS domain S-box-containing protein
LSGAVADLPLSAVGLFVRDTHHWRCVARAGGTGAIPERLPLEFDPIDNLAPGDAPTVIPLGSRKDPAGLLLVRGPATESAGADRNRLLLLAGVALSQHQSRRRERSEDASFLALFESLQEGALLLDQSGRLQEVNPALCKAIGSPAAELRHRPLADFLRPAEVEALETWLQASPPRPFRLAIEWQAPPKAGRAYELAGQPLAPAEADRLLWLGFLRDTSEGARTDDRARVAEARLEGVIDAVQDGVWLLDARGTIEAANQRLAQLLGVSPHDLGVGLPQAEILQTLKLNFARPDETCAAWDRLHDQPDQVAWGEVELLRPRRVLERFARPLLDAQQRLVGRLEVYRDVTDQRLPEDKLVHRERLATLGHLLSGIAHELNNPLTAVTGYAELLRDLRLTGPLKQKVDRLAEEAERAGRILKSVLLFARGDNHHKQSVDVAELLDRTLSLRSYELKVENIRVVREYQAGLPPVAANPTQLQQVFLNLLLNAEQAIRSQRQHGRITLRVRREPEPGSVQIEIADDGPGIASAVLPHIFETFFTTKAPAVGTGLGLSISQAIIRRHGGEISVESQSGQGAVFRIELPPQAAVAAKPPPPPPPRRQAPSRSGRRVLVVDDEPVVAHLIADTLRRQRFAVRVHTDSRRALEEASEKDFDLVICDLRMPELDGPAFYRLLQERKPDLSRRLLFTTGDTLARDTARFLEQVGLPNLAKPFHVDELTAAVGNVLRELEKAAPGENSSPPGDSRSGR